MRPSFLSQDCGKEEEVVFDGHKKNAEKRKRKQCVFVLSRKDLFNGTKVIFKTTTTSDISQFFLFYPCLIYCYHLLENLKFADLNHL